jgi:FAD/FMN-containing dehydrogenase
MAKGYAEGPAAEEAERRLEELKRGGGPSGEPELRHAVYGSTEDEPERHFIGWRDEVDPDELFASGKAWGITLVRATV